ncbi:MAG: V4R domain-containing protein [Planctomycetia bacterium]
MASMTTNSAIAPGVKPVGVQMLMRGNYFAEGDYARTDPGTGVTRNRAGTRIIALTSDFLMGLHRAIIDECGPAAGEVLKSCGRKWGVLFAKRFSSEMEQYYGLPLAEFPMATFQSCIIEGFSHHGMGLLQLDLSKHSAGLVVITLKSAVMGSLLERSDQPVDALMSGIFAGFFSELAGQDLDCEQTTCIACGADAGRFVISLRSRLTGAPQMVADRMSHDEIVRRLVDAKG